MTTEPTTAGGAETATSAGNALSSKERRLQKIQAVGLYLVTFGGSLLASLLVVFGSGTNLDEGVESNSLPAAIAVQIVMELGALWLFWALMRRRGGWKILTQRPTWRDLGRGIGLFAAVQAVYIVLYVLAATGSFLGGMGGPQEQQNVAAYDASGQSAVGIVLLFALMIVNPFCEECIARAWTQYHLEQLWRWRPWHAALASALLQATYHLYQGVFYAALYAVIFSAFAFYYANTRRLAPVVIAHLLADLGAVGFTLVFPNR